MRSSLTSSPIRLFLLRSFKYPRPLCSQSECLYKSISSEYPFFENPESNLDFPEKVTSDFYSLRNPTFSEPNHTHYTLPTLETADLTQTSVINSLLSYKNDPLSALRHFNLVEQKRGFAESLYSFGVLLHILMTSSKTHGDARNLLDQYVSGFFGPTSVALVDYLIECAKRFDFDLDPRVFNYLLGSYVKADKNNDAFECCCRMMERNIIPRVELVNKVLTDLVKRNFTDEVKELYNKMVLRGVSGDRVKVSTSLREEKHQQNPYLDDTSNHHQNPSDFNTENHSSIDFQQIPNGVYVDGSRSYRESTTNDYQNNTFQQNGNFSGYDWNNNGQPQINHNGAQAKMSWGGHYNMQNQYGPAWEGGGEATQKLHVNGNFMQNAGQYEQTSSDHHTGNVGIYPNSPSDYQRNQNAGLYQQNQNAGLYQQNPNVGQYLSSPNEIHNRTVTSQVVTNPIYGEESAEASESSQYNSTLKELDSFIEEGKVKEAVEVLGLLEKQLVPVDLPRLVQLMQACGKARVLEEAKAVHEHIVRSMNPLKVSSYNRILKMYSECGSMDDAFNVFNNMGQRNLTSWDTMITGLAKNGLGDDAIDLFSQFKEAGLKPDGQMFIGVFSACSVLGDVDEGMLHFESMIKDYGIIPSMKHYVSIVDMLGSIGYLYEALEFVEKMQMEPSVDVWETLMNLCRIHGNLELGDRCAELVEQLDPSRLNEKSKAGLVQTSDLVEEKVKKKLASPNIFEISSRVHEYRA